MAGARSLNSAGLASMALLEFSEGEIVRGATSYQTAIERARDVDRSVTKTARTGYAICCISARSTSNQ